MIKTETFVIPVETDSVVKTIYYDFKSCIYCKERKIVSEFNTNNKSKDGFQGYCRSCQNKKSKTWEKENRHKRNEYRLKYFSIEQNKIAANLRTRLTNSLKIDKYKHTLEYVGLSKEKLNEWLNFTKKYYVPENCDEQIDIEHMISFHNMDLNIESNIEKLMNWKNLRLMTHSENIRKGCKKIKFKDIAKQIYLTICFEKGVTPIIKYCRLY